MRAGDVITHIGIFAGDVLLDQPGLACQGAGVCPAVGGVFAAKAPRLAALIFLPPVMIRIAVMFKLFVYSGCGIQDR